MGIVLGLKTRHGWSSATRLIDRPRPAIYAHHANFYYWLKPNKLFDIHTHTYEHIHSRTYTSTSATDTSPSVEYCSRHPSLTYFLLFHRLISNSFSLFPMTHKSLISDVLKSYVKLPSIFQIFHLYTKRIIVKHYIHDVSLRKDFSHF